jgi:uncharacterized membrane protein
MPHLKRRLLRWFCQHFRLIRNPVEETSEWLLEPRSCLGFVIFFLVSAITLVIAIAYPIVLIFKIFPLVFSTLILRLGIAEWLSWLLLVATVLGCWVNLPLFALTVHAQRQQQVKFELWPIWRLKYACSRWYRIRHYTCGRVSVNVGGALIPIGLALYQFSRVPPTAILSVTAIVTLCSYYMVNVKPGAAIVAQWSRFWLIIWVAAVAAMVLSSGSGERLDVAVAFAGGVLGTTIGADLLHLKDVVSAEVEPGFLSIGGAGLDDGIAQCGLFALIIVEWSPMFVGWLLAHI